MFKIIKKDVFNLSQRIKKINSNFVLVYSLKKKRLEVHTKQGDKTTFFCLVPNQKLDMRLIGYLCKTRNIDYFTEFRKIDEHNARQEQKNMQETTYLSQNRLGEIFRYSVASKDFDDKNSYKDVWI